MQLLTGRPIRILHLIRRVFQQISQRSHVVGGCDSPFDRQAFFIHQPGKYFELRLRQCGRVTGCVDEFLQLPNAALNPVQFRLDLPGFLFRWFATVSLLRSIPQPGKGVAWMSSQ